MRNRYNAGILRLVRRRRMGVLLTGNPGRPGTAVHKRIPGIITGMVSLRPFFPACGHGALHHGVFLLDIIYQISIHVIRTRRLGIKSEPVTEFAKHIVHNGLFILHGKHPDTKIFGLIFLTKFLAGKTQKR